MSKKNNIALDTTYGQYAAQLLSVTLVNCFCALCSFKFFKFPDFCTK